MQILEFAGVPLTKDDFMQVTMDLDAKLNVDLEQEDNSIVHRFLVKHCTSRISSGSKHPTIIVRLVSR